MTLPTWLRTFLDIDIPPLSPSERRRATLGALLFVGVASLLLQHFPVGAWSLLAPVGASTVILYALPHSPVAAPWAVLGSYLVGTACGLAVLVAVPYPPLAAALGVAACVWGMARLNCIHPPGGAVPLMMVLAAPRTAEAMALLAAAALVNVLLMLALAVLINTLVLGRRYPWHAAPAPGNPHLTGDVPAEQRLGLLHEDLDHAVRRLDTFIDVQEGELVTLYNLAVDHAFERHTSLTCGDVMSRDLITVTFSTGLDEAWAELSLHRIRALPVVDGFGRLLGIVTLTDFLRELDHPPLPALGVRLRDLLRRTPGTHSEKAEVVGQIMTRAVVTAAIDMPITSLVHILAEKAVHHIPVLDDTQRVVGIVTPSDINAALYKQLALRTP